MLYVTTRNNRDAFTANRALLENRGPDGGMYIPLRMPSFSADEIHSLADKSFNQCVCDVLNLLFSTRLTSWDMDFTVGRRPVRLASISHRVTAAECWHNPEWEFERLVRDLTGLLQGNRDSALPATDWVRIAVRIGVLFGIYGELIRFGMVTKGKKVDISLVSGDFSAPMAAWYARKWGLPIGRIICCCNENNLPWELLHLGVMKTGAVALQTGMPEADIALPEDLERLIHACGGPHEVMDFVDHCRVGKNYFPDEALLMQMREGIHVSVVSSKRLDYTIPSVYHSHGYVLGQFSALAYSGLLDCRASTGEITDAVILSDKGALCSSEMVSRAMGIPEEELHRLLQ